MYKKRFLMVGLVAMAAVALGACTHAVTTQEDSGVMMQEDTAPTEDTQMQDEDAAMEDDSMMQQ